MQVSTKGKALKSKISGKQGPFIDFEKEDAQTCINVTGVGPLTEADYEEALGSPQVDRATGAELKVPEYRLIETMKKRNIVSQCNCICNG
jgi:hypothetical protein